jgi:acyl transferase domain-containing protein
VISGPFAAVDKLERRLAEEKIDCQRLRTSHAFHSQMMDPILDEFTRAAAKVKLNSPQIPFISNVSGTWIQATDATDPRYWATHLRNTVRFADGIVELSKESERFYLEVGPSRTLTALVGYGIASLGRQRDGRSDLERLLEAVGRLWVAGAPIDWQRMYDRQTRRRVPLSTYPFERKRYWIEPEATMPEAPSARNGSASVVETFSNEPAEIEHILEQQLQLMSQQLDLLSNS